MVVRDVNFAMRTCRAILSFMSARKFATLDFEERRQVIDGVYQQLAPKMTEVINQHLSRMTPEIQQIVRSEVGKFAVTETQAKAFLDGMMISAAEKAAIWFRPRFLMRLFFRARI